MKKTIMLGAAVVAAFIASPPASADETASNIPAFDRPAPNIPHGVSGEPAGARSVCS
ncbi:hypothetical protein AB0L13_44735 [Saccharopolyspora shandongensis]|uniref:hypothetical protein n=1 Tax=Saccharopolyspora shandongensis TaxID=418495 RepID=UPI00343F4028